MSFDFMMQSILGEIEQFRQITAQTQVSSAGLADGRGQMESRTPEQWFLDEATSRALDVTRKLLLQWSA
jgi:hypothetical protein